MTNHITWCHNIDGYVSIFSYYSKNDYHKLLDFASNTTFTDRIGNTISDISHIYFDNQTIFIEAKYDFLPVMNSEFQAAIDKCIQYLYDNKTMRMEVSSNITFDEIWHQSIDIEEYTDTMEEDEINSLSDIELEEYERNIDKRSYFSTSIWYFDEEKDSYY